MPVYKKDRKSIFQDSPPSSTGDTWGHHAASPMDFLRWISGATPLLISSNYHSNGESGRESASEIHRFFGIFKRLGCSMPCDFFKGKVMGVIRSSTENPRLNRWQEATTKKNCRKNSYPLVI